MNEYSEWSNEKLLDEYVGNLLRPYRGTEEIRAAILKRMQPTDGMIKLKEDDILQVGDEVDWLKHDVIDASWKKNLTMKDINAFRAIRPIHQGVPVAQPEPEAPKLTIVSDDGYGNPGAPELLPCPFCGLAPLQSFDDLMGVWRIMCNNEYCSAECRIEKVELADAIEAWNTRAFSPSAATAIEKAYNIAAVQLGLARKALDEIELFVWQPDETYFSSLIKIMGIIDKAHAEIAALDQSVEKAS